MTFEELLSFGRIAESEIAAWLRSRGHCVMPVYEIEIGQGKGPQFYAPSDSYAAPDLLVLGKKTMWVEAKHKSVFSWHRITQKWVTGIDLNHYSDYQKVRDMSEIPVWVLFRHKDAEPDPRDIEAGSPIVCPTGLFGNDLDYLVENENHRHEGWGRHGMVYWARDNLVDLSQQFKKRAG